jgi:peptide/nickel transport system substrate-binding protein
VTEITRMHTDHMFDRVIELTPDGQLKPMLAESWRAVDPLTWEFKLRKGVKFHDGTPFTSEVLKFTLERILDKGYNSLQATYWVPITGMTTPDESTIVIKTEKPMGVMPYTMALTTPVLPNVGKVSAQFPATPIGTGPFKFVEFKPNEHIKVTKNPDYWKPGRPYLDGIEYTIMRDTSSRNLAFFAGKFDAIVLGVTIPTLKDFKEQAPQAICQQTASNVPRTMLINFHKPPFDNPELRRAMALSIDRKAFLDILNQGVGTVGALMLPAPQGVWGMPTSMLEMLPGYGPDVEKNRAEAKKIMEKLGYGPDKRLTTKVSTRNFPGWRDPAVVLISHLRDIYIDAELELVDTALWYPKMVRKDYTVGMVPIEAGVDDPDQMFYENFYSGAARNYAGYSDPEFDKLVDRQSQEADPEKRKQIVWQAERKLAEAAFRPVLNYPAGAGCWQPWFKGHTMMTNSIYNGWRMEDVWLDK